MKGGMERRAFLRASMVAGGAMVATPLRALAALAEVVEAAEAPVALRAPGNGGYGPLRPAGKELDLPHGFSYVRFGAEGEPMANGRPTPGHHDGMAAFGGPRKTVRLIRNHEVDGVTEPFGGRTYDHVAGGGCVTLVFDTSAGRLLASHPTLTGTLRNCAGGVTPWGSWLSCEEAHEGLDHGFAKPHGYCFEVPAGASSPAGAEPLRAMGRFVREAVCVRPWTGDVYQTEDQETAGFYRYRPLIPGSLGAGGRLQMLGVEGRPRYDTRTGQQRWRHLPVAWVDIPDPDPHHAGRNPLAVFQQGWERGGAVFRRLEGCVWHRGRALFVSTTGGDAGLGQVWEYRPGIGGGRLTLVLESPWSGLLRHPDNVTVSPRGGVLLCEDGGGRDRLCGVTPEGGVFTFARNRFSDGEFAGATFSPDGDVLFVNVQHPGVTFAVTGPWRRGPL